MNKINKMNKINISLKSLSESLIWISAFISQIIVKFINYKVDLLTIKKLIFIWRRQKCSKLFYENEL
jgi:hypothetical protein